MHEIAEMHKHPGNAVRETSPLCSLPHRTPIHDRRVNLTVKSHHESIPTYAEIPLPRTASTELSNKSHTGFRIVTSYPKIKIAYDVVIASIMFHSRLTLPPSGDLGVISRGQ